MGWGADNTPPVFIRELEVTRSNTMNYKAVVYKEDFHKIINSKHPGSLRVFVYILSHLSFQNNGEFYTTSKKIGEDLKLSACKVREMISFLNKEGLIKCKRERNTVVYSSPRTFDPNTDKATYFHSEEYAARVCNNTEFQVYNLIASMSSGKDWCFPSQQYMAEQLNVTPKTISEVVNNLAKKYIIKVKFFGKGHNSTFSNSYSIPTAVERYTIRDFVSQIAQGDKETAFNFYRIASSMLQNWSPEDLRENPSFTYSPSSTTIQKIKTLKEFK